MTHDNSLHLAHAVFTLLSLSLVLPRAYSPDIWMHSLFYALFVMWCGHIFYVSSTDAKSVSFTLLSSPFCLLFYFFSGCLGKLRSSANGIACGGVLPSSFAKTSMIIVKWRGWTLSHDGGLCLTLSNQCTDLSSVGQAVLLHILDDLHVSFWNMLWPQAPPYELPRHSIVG